MKLITLLLSVVLIMGSAFSADKVPAEPIGKVIAVDGKANASGRTLARGTSIFVSDVIKVAKASKIQIKFTDGGLLNLIELTEYRINTYAFQKAGKNEYTAELVKGGFRELTGSIGKANPKGFKVKTPVATIGIRGTIFAARIQNGEVSFGCDSGELSISNDAGSRDIGPGQFVTAASFDQLGDITDIRPDSLSQDLFTPPSEAESLESAEESIAAPAEEEEAASAEEEEADSVEEEEAPTEEEQDLGEDEELEVPENEGNPPC